MQDVVMAAMERLQMRGDFTTHALAFFLIMARMVPLTFLTPVFGSKHAPAQAKIGMSIVFTLVIYLPVFDSLNAPIPRSLFPFVGLMLKEIFIGMEIGFVISLIFYAVMMSGRMMDTAATRSMAEVQAPHTAARATVLGNILYMYLLVVFFALGGHRVLLQGLMTSYLKFNILDTAMSAGSISVMANMLMQTIADIFYIAVLIAAPVMVATFLTDVSFGLMNRVAPQLNAYFMSMPVKALGSIVILFIAWGVLSEVLFEYVIWIIRRALTIVTILGLGGSG